MRLIDADVLKTYLKYVSEADVVSLKKIIKAIDKQPTAYDIDKVVEELEELEVKAITRYKNGDFGNFDGVDYYIKKSEALEIVKQGCVSDDVCEWRIGGVYLISPHKTPYVTSLLEPEEYKYKYCPVCGKKIKVITDED